MNREANGFTSILVKAFNGSLERLYKPVMVTMDKQKRVL